LFPILVVAGALAGALLFSRRAAASVPDAEIEGSFLQDVLSAVSGVIARGIRNNNPGNIRRTETRWQGERAEVTDTVFEEFETPEDGIRAMAVLLTTYRTRYGLNTIEGIIARWAPSNENDTAAYADAVSRRMGIQLTAPLTDQDLPGLIVAIIRHENGVQPYDVATIERGVQAA
jgi:hypothetical protein